MKKTTNKRDKKGLKGLFCSIISFFDKWLITPITKGILGISDFFKNNSQKLEKILSKKQTLIVISLIFAFIVFILIDKESTVMLDQYAEILYNQEVTAIYNEEAYVVEGLPETVDITLIGKKRHIYLAKQNPIKSVSVDLTGLKPGSHKVSLKFTQPVASLDYKLDPSTVQVVIYEKMSETRELTVDVLHKDSLDSKLYIKGVELSRNNAIIKGAEHNLKKVATVKALVDVNNISNPEVGELTLKDVPLVAYDDDGKIVDVEIVPSKVDAKLLITSPNKEVPIKVIPVGELAFGKSIKTLTSNVSSVVVYGEEDAISNLEYIPVEIDIKNLDENKEFNINIEKPNGVREISTKTIVVKLVLDDLATKEIEGYSLQAENLDTTKYGAQVVGEENSQITVIVKGSQEVIEQLDTSSIRVYVDLANYGVGEHEVEVKIQGDDVRLSYSAKTKKVQIRITQK